jgi:hypothetical protein
MALFSNNTFRRHAKRLPEEPRTKNCFVGREAVSFDSGRFRTEV